MSEIPWCEEHQCYYELYDDRADEPEYYACHECKREDGEAMERI